MRVEPKSWTPYLQRKPLLGIIHLSSGIDQDLTSRVVIKRQRLPPRNQCPARRQLQCLEAIHRYLQWRSGSGGRVYKHFPR